MKTQTEKLYLELNRRQEEYQSLWDKPENQAKRRADVNREKWRQILDLGNEIQEIENEQTEKLKVFFDSFPDNATSWEQATDELADMHNYLAEEFPGYMGNIFVSAGGKLPDAVRQSPAVRNTLHKKAILDLLPQLNATQSDAFFERFFAYAKGGALIEFTDAEDRAYDKWMSHFLNNGLNDLKAEAETLKELKNEFPRLVPLMKGNYKIKLATGGATDIGEKTYYSTWEKGYSWKEFVETEVAERGNYSRKEVNAWKRKYNIPNQGNVLMWVATSPQHSLQYAAVAESHYDIHLPIHEFEKKYGVSIDWLTQLTEKQGTVIKESDDGDGGYLMVLNEEFEAGGSMFRARLNAIPMGHGKFNGFADRGELEKASRHAKFADGGEIKKENWLKNQKRQAIDLANGVDWEWKTEWEQQAKMYNKPIPKFIPLPPQKQAEIVADINRYYDVILEYEENKEGIIARKEKREELSHTAKQNMAYATNLLCVLIDCYATGYHPNCSKADRAKEKERIEDGIDLLKEFIDEDKAAYSQKMNEAIDAQLTDLQILEEEMQTLSNALEYLDESDKALIEEKIAILEQAIAVLGEPEPIKSAFESNIEALVHPETGMAATIAKMDTGQKEKEAFLKRTTGMTLADYKKLDAKAKEKIQKKWVDSEEFKSLETKTESISEALVNAMGRMGVCSYLSTYHLDHAALDKTLSKNGLWEITLPFTEEVKDGRSPRLSESRLKADFLKDMEHKSVTVGNQEISVEKVGDVRSNTDSGYTYYYLDVMVKVLPKEEALGNWEHLFSAPEKFIDYSGQYLYPPRIEHKMQPSSLAKLDTGDYVGQPKLNGSNTSIALSANKLIVKNRHNEFFAIPPKFDFQSMYSGVGWMSFAGEFMNKSKLDHNKQPFRGFVIWDIMAYDGKILIGSTITERIALLDLLYPKKEPAVAIDGITVLFKTDYPDIYRANDFFGDFETVYKIISQIDMVEGFVKKRLTGKLENMTREANNTGWSVKVRKPTKNYHFWKGGTIEPSQIGTPVKMMKGEHKDKSGFIADIKTDYTIKLDDGNTVSAIKGDFYNTTLN